jgi:hypothetical protein
MSHPAGGVLHIIPASFYHPSQQTGALFSTVLIGLVSLASCSLITVLSYTALSFLSLVLLVKLYREKGFIAK